MRRLAILSVVLLAACAHEQPPQPAVNGQQVELPTDVAPITEGDVTTATVNGMRIIVKRTPGAEFAAGQLYILGGVQNWTAQNAGIEQLAISVATQGGTRDLDKDAFARRLASLGSEIGGGTSNDFSVISCKSLLPAWDETFGMMVGTFLQPALPASELEIARARQLASLRHEQESPDARLGLLAHKTLFANHPYANRSVGTMESVAAVKAADLAPYLGKLHDSGRLILVVVGDLDPMHVITQAKKAFAGLPRGDFHTAYVPPLNFTAPTLTTEERKLPTNYIEGVFVGPSWQDADLPAGMVAMSLLSNRLFEEVRTKRNLSYAPGASLRGGSRAPTGMLYVTAVDPNTTFKVMLDEVHKLQQQPISEKELAGTKSIFLTGFLSGEETVDGQAAMLGKSVIYAGDWHFAKTLPERVKSVTAADVQKFAQGRMHGLQTFVVGDPGKADPTVFKSL